MNANQYQCAMCKGVFDLVRDENWDDEKADAELKQMFGDIPKDCCEVVCDSCWQKVRPDTHPEQFAAYKAEFN